jgi:hypothetical protein
MNTPISSKLAALAVALMMNSLIAGGVAYLFKSQIQESAINTGSHQTTAQAALEVA